VADRCKARQKADPARQYNEGPIMRRRKTGKSHETGVSLTPIEGLDGLKIPSTFAGNDRKNG
jgi:hypothetical protein